MDYLAEIYLNYQTIHIDELIGPKARKGERATPEDVYLYACEDTDITLKLKNILEKKVKENEKLKRNLLFCIKWGLRAMRCALIRMP